MYDCNLHLCPLTQENAWQTGGVHVWTPDIGQPSTPVHRLDSDARVLYVGTFSKALFPALRVGYVVVPTDLMAAFSAARDAADIFPSTLFQAVLTDFIREGRNRVGRSRVSTTCAPASDLASAAAHVH